MVAMSQRMMDLFNDIEVAVLSTSSRDGVPNAVPVGAKKIVGPETVLISDQFFGKTLANLKANPQAALTFWKGREGYQLKGSITIEVSGPLFEETSRWIAEARKKKGFPMACKGVVLLHIEKIFGVSSGPKAGRQLA